MSFSLGYTPQKMTVVLSADGDFVASMTSTTGTWPGDGLTLVLSDSAGETVASWEADISGAVASWSVDRSDVALAIGAKARRARLIYVDGDLDLPMAAGAVTVA